jgi:hypothetical protein
LLFLYIMKQATNSAVRFSTYTFLTEEYDSRFLHPTSNYSNSASPTSSSPSRPSGITFFLGALSGVVTVYASQPFE